MWPFLEFLKPITDYIAGPSSTPRPSLDLTPILHPFINVGQCFGSGEYVPFTVTLNIKKTIVSFVEGYTAPVGTGRLLTDSIGRY